MDRHVCGLPVPRPLRILPRAPIPGADAQMALRFCLTCLGTQENGADSLSQNSRRFELQPSQKVPDTVLGHVWRLPAPHSRGSWAPSRCQRLLGRIPGGESLDFQNRNDLDVKGVLFLGWGRTCSFTSLPSLCEHLGNTPSTASVLGKAWVLLSRLVVWSEDGGSPVNKQAFSDGESMGGGDGVGSGLWHGGTVRAGSEQLAT